MKRGSGFRAIALFYGFDVSMFLCLLTSAISLTPVFCVLSVVLDSCFKECALRAVFFSFLSIY